MDKPVFDTKKAQAILSAIHESVDKLTVAHIQVIAEAQRDKLDSWRCTLVFATDATQVSPKVSAQLSYGGKRYKESL